VSEIGQMGQLGTVPKWGNVGAILIARQNRAKKRGGRCHPPQEISQKTPLTGRKQQLTKEVLFGYSHSSE